MRRFLPLAFSALAACSSESSGTGVPTTTDTGVTINDTSTPTDTAMTTDTGTTIEDSTTPTDTGVVDSATADTTVADSTPPTDTAMTADSGPGDIGKARIHEVYIDRNLEGDKVEYVEIAAPAGTPLQALWLRAIDSKGTPIFNLPVGATGDKVGAKGLWVVGTIGITAVDKVYSLSEWGFPNDGGSIQLTRSDGIVVALVDVVGYGGAPATTATEPKKTIEGTAATLPASGSTKKTIGRKSVPGDTDDNLSDFCVMTATPGAANGSCL